MSATNHAAPKADVSIAELSRLRFDRDGLVTVVVQDALTGEVRMVAHANVEAVHATLTTGRATFWSRSRNELWEKGKSSGNGLAVRRVLVDCDADALLYVSEPEGPSCHTGSRACFARALGDADAARDGARDTEHDAKHDAKHARPFAPATLFALEDELEARKTSSAKASYTRSLYDGGPEAVRAKMLEEAREFADAVAGEDPGRVASEAADVLYHLLVGLRMRDVGLREVCEVLEKRSGKSGHAEKASRAV